MRACKSVVLRTSSMNARAPAAASSGVRGVDVCLPRATPSASSSIFFVIGSDAAFCSRFESVQ